MLRVRDRTVQSYCFENCLLYVIVIQITCHVVCWMHSQILMIELKGLPIEMLITHPIQLPRPLES